MILVIEDNLMLAKFFALAIEAAGYTTDIALTGEEALKKLSERTYRMVFVDLGIPGINGFTVVATARILGVTAPMIAITGQGDVPDDVMRSAGFSGPLIHKPIRLSALTAMVQKLCGASDA